MVALRYGIISYMSNQPKSEIVEFNGIIFRRYPNSKYFNHRNYYAPNGKHIKNGVKNLHVEIWKSVRGEVPKGCHIHHKDGDALNNSIENLECISAKEHFAIHSVDAKVRSAIAWQDTEKFKSIQQQSAKWHKSDEGKKWHQEHAKKVFGNVPKVERKCEQCSSMYLTRVPHKSRFCSNRCKSKFRRDTKADYVSKKCERCDKVFSSNKFEATRFCSKFCSARRSTAFFSRQKIL